MAICYMRERETTSEKGMSFRISRISQNVVDFVQTSLLEERSRNVL